MRWYLSHRADTRAVRLADRHYTRQKIGSPQFVPPGRCMVLLSEHADALWVTSFPFAEYVKHAWAGAWVCSCFRNEGTHLSSELIREAVAATRWYCASIWAVGEPPQGMITFVDRSKVASVHPGYCYKQAGWQQVGKTASGLIALQQRTGQMPQAEPPCGAQLALFDLAGEDYRRRARGDR